MSLDEITPEEWNQMAHNAGWGSGRQAIEVPKGWVPKEQSDGSTASYYELPKGSTELQDLIGAKNMNAQIGEIFRACYRYGEVAHSPEIRDIKKILFYANAELNRLYKLQEQQHG